MLGFRSRVGGIWIAAAGTCALAGCLDGGRDTNPTLGVVTSPGAPPEPAPNPFPCTLSMGTSGRFDGLCAASWRAHDAGSVSNPVRIEVTMTGSTGLGSTAM